MTIDFKTYGGMTLRADVAGSSDDPSVLLVHGGAQTRRMWDDVAAALVGAGRQVIRLDLRGHGESDRAADGRYDIDAFVEDLRIVLDQLGSRPVVVAASLGGWIAALALTERGAHLASGLVLVDAPPEIPPEAAARLAGRLRDHAARAGDAIDWDPRVLETVDFEAARKRVAQSGAKLTVPVLYVRGVNSEISERESVQRFLDDIPKADLAEIENAGHLVAEERLDAFNALVLAFVERTAPRRTAEYRSGSDVRTLRDAMGCFATGVTVVTACDAEGCPVGLTANSFTSVSLDPPLVLVCIAKTAGSLAVLSSQPNFAINVLHIGQQPTSNRFARKEGDRFADVAWEPGASGAPILQGGLAAFECTRDAIHDAGDHVILIGRVDRARFDPYRDPLLYFRGRYRRLHFH
ncbi:MAG: alpha/beta fold hydrolase [Caulobacterales bacterium]